MKERKEKENINKTERDDAKLERKKEKKKHRKTIVVKVTVALLLS